MTPELTYLAWAAALAVLQIAIQGTMSVLQVGLPYAASARDEGRTGTGTAGRLERAVRNYGETLPAFAIAILVAHAAGISTSSTILGAQIYFWGRVAYLPAYFSGVPYLRTTIWGISMVGLIIVLAAVIV